MIKIFCFCFSWLFLIPFVSKAQTIGEFQKLWLKESKDFLFNQQTPQPYFQSGFYFFSRNQDDQFAEVLNGEWTNALVLQGNPIPKSKQLSQNLTFNFEQTYNHLPQDIQYDLLENSEYSATYGTPVIPRIRKPDYPLMSNSSVSFVYFGNSLTLNYDPLLGNIENKNISHEAVATFWQKFTVANSQQLINQLFDWKDQFGINDWGYICLVKTCASAIYPENDKASTLLSWALLIRSGYNVKIGYNQIGSTLLFPSSTPLFAKSSLTIGSIKFWVDNPISSLPIETYKGDHPGSSRLIDLNFTTSLNFSGRSAVKNMKFDWKKRTYEFSFTYNPEVIRYYEEYPQTDLNICFNAPFTYIAKESLVKQLAPVISGMSTAEGVAFLQQFVQKSFTYRMYNDLYGHDKFMFPEEVLFKEECNDKGRAILFAWLTTNLLNQNSALLFFPGFCSAAIAFDQSFEGDNLIYRKKVYTMADPTFSGAPIGLMIPEFYGERPVIVPLSNSHKADERAASLWNLAGTIGAERGGSKNDCIIDDEGNGYLTGFFRDKKNIANLKSEPFVACFRSNNTLAWMQKFESDRSATGIELMKLNDNEIFMAGSFQGKIKLDNHILQSCENQPDLFIAQFNSKGELGWLDKCGIDSLYEDVETAYSVSFNRSRENITVQLMNETERNCHTGFSNGKEKGLFFIGSRYQTTGMHRYEKDRQTPQSLGFKRYLNIAVKNQNDMKCDPSLTGLIAFLEMMRFPGTEINGAQLVALIQQRNPQFENLNPNLCNKLRLIVSLKNRDGIITITIANRVSLWFPSLKISNSARFKIIPLDNGDIKIITIDGFNFLSPSLKGIVNEMIADQSSGNILINFDHDHTLTTRSLRRELTNK